MAPAISISLTAGPGHILHINCANAEGQIWVSADELEAVSGFAPDLSAEIAFAPAGRGPGPLVPPDPAQPETRYPRIDTNGNDEPDPEDGTVHIERQANTIISYVLGQAHLVVQCLMSNPNPLTGAFQTCEIDFPLFEDLLPLQSPVQIWQPFDATLTPLAGPPRSIKTTITVDGYDPHLRPNSLKITVQVGDVVVEIGAKLVDDDDDGLGDAIELESTFPLPVTRVEWDREDVDGDGKDDHLSLQGEEGPKIFIPLADTNGDGIPDAPALDLDHDGVADPNVPVAPFGAGPANPTSEQKLHFAQFGDGAGFGVFLFSEITLFNLDTETAATVKVLLKDDDGNPLTVDLNGEEVTGEKDIVIGAGSVVTLRTDGVGPLVVGSVTVCADRAVGGVILFGGTAGVAGVGISNLQAAGFVASVERRTATEVNTGIAVMNPTAEAANYTLQLCDKDGKVLATAQLALAARGHRALFVDEIVWDKAVDLSDFEGLIKLVATTPVAATVLQSRPGEFATLPVAPNYGATSNGGGASVPVSIHGSGSALPLNQKLRFAQFADGAGLFSQLILFNLTDKEANVNLILKDDDGNPLSVDLDDEVVAGEKSLVIPPGGLRVLSTDGIGDLQVGSVTVCSDRALAGVILFAGGAGVAGVGSGSQLQNGFVAPMQSDSSQGLNTGIAVMNLEEEAEVTLELKLYDVDRKLLATAEIVLGGMGHRARFLHEIDWQFEDGVEIDIANFDGLLEVTADGLTSATVLQTRTGVFATQPVVPGLN